MSNSDTAKQICEELGIAWNENATSATLCGEPIGCDALRSSFFGQEDLK